MRRVERKFITDVIARPRPLAVAGHIEHFQFDFATHTLTIRLQPNAKLGGSGIFVPLERHYPDGLHIEIGSGLTLALRSGIKRLVEVKAADQTNREQARAIRWDDDFQHLIIEKWILTDPVVTVKIMPMLRPSPPEESQP